LARAGTPVGILIKRYLKWKYSVEASHYSISIIRGRGIDKNAMSYLLDHHVAKDILFVDGWIGKGAILKELEKEIAEFEGVSAELAVLADPANVTKLCGTHQDILIPSSCLNCTVSGLVSRNFLRGDIIGEHDFHGAVYYEGLEEQDLSYNFINEIESKFELNPLSPNTRLGKSGIIEVKEIVDHFQVGDINLVKPGIGETTRVLLRRLPWKVLISQKYKEDISLNHIIKLANEKNVPIEYYPLANYKCCGIIRKLADV
jgi:hypothetical protein